MKEDQDEILISEKALAKEETITEKIGNFFAKIGYNIADFCRDHPMITRSTLLTLSTTAGFFTAGPPGAIGGFVAGLQRGSDLLKFCNEFCDKYEEKQFEKQNQWQEKEGKGVGKGLEIDGAENTQNESKPKEKTGSGPNPEIKIISATSIGHESQVNTR